MNQFKFGDHVKHPKHKGKLIFIESFEEVSLLKKEWAEVLSEEAGDFVFVPLEELEPASQEEAPATKYRHINGHKFPEPCSEPFKDGQSYFAVSLEAGAEVSHYRWYDDNHDNRLLNSGLIHTTQEAAQAHADAINSLFRGEPCPD